MSGMEVASAEGRSEMVAQHHLQLDLLRTLQTAIADGRPKAVCDEILDTLVTYTDVHFMSEQRMMRLHAYPDYRAHQLDHDRSMALLEEIRAAWTGDGQERVAQLAGELEKLLVTHMDGADQVLGAFLADQAAGSSG